MQNRQRYLNLTLIIQFWGQKVNPNAKEGKTNLRRERGLREQELHQQLSLITSRVPNTHLLRVEQ